MNDRYDPYESHDPYAPGDPYGTREPRIVGYDAYGQPVYQQPPAPAPGQEQPAYDPQPPYPQDQQDQQAPPYPQEQAAPPYPQDPYGQQTHQQPPYEQPQAYDPYAYGRPPAQPQPQPQPQSPPQPPVQPQPGYGYDPYAQQAGYVPQPIPEPEPEPEHDTAPAEDAGGADGSAPRRDGGDAPDYRTEQFSFIEEPDEDSEDVIDWLKFTESRTERREEARRRGRSRVVALVVVLALVVVGGIGYLWAAGKLPGTSDTATGKGAAETGPQRRDVIVVHLVGTAKDSTPSTALLVDNTTTEQGTTVLLPEALALADDDGQSTTLAKAVDDAGPAGAQEAVATLLGTRIDGTWRLDTPFLENLVEQVGTIDVDTDTDVPDPKAKRKGAAPLVKKGEQQTLSGLMAVAYATYQGPDETRTAQLERFGQVLQAVLRKFPTDAATSLLQVQTLGQVLDPSLLEKDLAAALAKLAERAKGGDYRTTLLPVESDGTLSEKTSENVVKDILGGSVTAPAEGAPVRVGVENATGSEDDSERARAALVNGGFGYVGGGKAAAAQLTSQVTYADPARKADAAEIAKTLGLPASAVTKGKVASNADVSVVLGQDYKG